MNKKSVAVSLKSLWELSEELGAHDPNVANIRHRLELHADNLAHDIFPNETLDQVIAGKNGKPRSKSRK
jgi:hypothetical protein